MLQLNIFNYNPTEPFDMIICSGVFEHLNPYHRRDYTNYLFGMLKKNGLFCCLRNTNNLFSEKFTLWLVL
uniref:Methyltransferase type 11 domain-containing protein n=1 Tax=Kuenenia stuttgartiensis TaxID=174633 RepID=Q1Q6V2_KUEST|nr:unknown protein [Candidatus Kuenenia stuttgartiensis]